MAEFLSWIDKLPLPYVMVFFGVVFLVGVCADRNMKTKQKRMEELRYRSLRLEIAEKELDPQIISMFYQELEWARSLHRRNPNAFNVEEYMRGFMNHWIGSRTVEEEKKEKEKPEREVRVVRILP